MEVEYEIELLLALVERQQEEADFVLHLVGDDVKLTLEVKDAACVLYLVLPVQVDVASAALDLEIGEEQAVVNVGNDGFGLVVVEANELGLRIQALERIKMVDAGIEAAFFEVVLVVEIAVIEERLVIEHDQLIDVLMAKLKLRARRRVEERVHALHLNQVHVLYLPPRIALPHQVVDYYAR